MNWTSIAIDILLAFYVLDCLFMGLVILMQRSKQEGLGAAFGGNIMSEFAGAQTSAVLVKATVYAAIIFFILSITLARLYSHLDVIEQRGSPVQQLLSQPVAAPKAAAPAATTPTPATTTAPAPIAPTPSAAAATPPATSVPSPVTPTTAKPATTPPPASK